MLAYYFSTTDKKLRYGDSRSIELNTTHTVDGKPICCRHGLHASERLIDALAFAPGPILYRVELGGEMDITYDKIAAQSRKYLSTTDLTDILKLFARLQALINIRKIKPYCTPEDYAVILNFLNTGDTITANAANAAANAATAAAYAVTYAANTAANAAAYAANAAAYAARAAYIAANAATRVAYTAYAARVAADAAANVSANAAADAAANDMLMYLVKTLAPEFKP